MPELGRAAEWLALVAAVAAALAPVLGRPRWAVRLLGLAAASAGVATADLAHALVTGDHSLAYVADFSRRDAGAAYRLAGMWGGNAGSLLWLATLVGACGLVAACRTAGLRPRALVAAVGGATLAGLLAMVVGLADPFARLAVPATDGAGLTPILEHRAMLYHPPLLYLGLASLVAPFALTAAALADGRLDDGWLATVRRWSLVPWCLLGLGMVAGAHWAYVELGWGGYWAWDPVENTALLPWLGLTLLLHAARAVSVPRAPVSRLAVAGLACLPFVLALLGNLLTRSGATTSVHAFAEARAVGRALGVAVAAAVAAVAVLLARQGRRDRAAGGRHRPTGPALPGRLLAGHLAVVGAVLAVVLVGTLWPLVSDLRGDDGVAVAGRYFARFTGPLAVAGLALACLAPLAVGAARRAHPLRATLVPGVAGAAAAVCLLAAATPALGAAGAVLGAAAGAATGTAAAGAVRAVRGGLPAGGHLAHAALGLTLAGVAGTTAGGGTTAALAPGESVEVLGHRIAHAGVEVAPGPAPGSRAVVAAVEVDGQRLRPALVAFPDRGVLLAETSLRSTVAGDVQVGLVTARDDGTAVLEVGVHPLQVLVWWGGLALVLAGGAALRDATTTRPARLGVLPRDRGPSATSRPAPAGTR
ncbi:MAG TPA: cytochrome c biogenesis protein CcsA [Acidimicrobiales bacterium]